MLPPCLCPQGNTAFLMCYEIHFRLCHGIVSSYFLGSFKKYRTVFQQSRDILRNFSITKTIISTSKLLHLSTMWKYIESKIWASEDIDNTGNPCHSFSFCWIAYISLWIYVYCSVFLAVLLSKQPFTAISWAQIQTCPKWLFFSKIFRWC